MYMTIARGRSPQEAFWIAQNMGHNGPEIREKERMKMYDVPITETPADFAFRMVKQLKKGKLNIPKEQSGCIQILQADPAGTPNQLFDPRLAAFIFFGLA